MPPKRQRGNGVPLACRLKYGLHLFSLHLAFGSFFPEAWWCRLFPSCFSLTTILRAMDGPAVRLAEDKATALAQDCYCKSYSLLALSLGPVK